IGEIPSLTKQCPGVSSDLDVLLRKLVAKKPDDRYQAMTDVCAALERFLKGEPVEEPEPEDVSEATSFEVPDAEETVAVVEAAEDVSLTNLPMVKAEAPSSMGGF